MAGVPAVLEPFAWSLVQLVQYSNESLCKPREYIHLDKSDSSFHATARNALAKRMLGEWLWMTDTDHSFEPDLLTRMVTLMNESNIDVLTGVYRYKNYPYLPVLFRFNEDATCCHPIAAIGGTGGRAPLVEIDCAGAGCLLVRKRVFLRIWQELKEEPFDIKSPLSEDFSFFARLKKLGIKAYCAPNIESFHLQSKKISSSDTNLAGINGVNFPMPLYVKDTEKNA